MERQQTHQQHSGFLLGILVGVAVTLLITTKKGRHMLQALTEEGKGKFGDWEQILKDVADAIEDDTDEFSGDDYVPQAREHRTESMSEEPVVRRVSDTFQPAPPPAPVHTMPVHHADHHHHAPEHAVSDSPVTQPVSPVATQHVTMPETQRYAQPAVYGEPVVPHDTPAPIHHSEESTPITHTASPVTPYQPPVASISRPRATSRRFFRNTPRR